MRVALVTAYFDPHVGGIERFVETLAEGLAARSHEVTVICCRTDAQSPVHERRGGYDIRRVAATNVIERRVRVPYPLPSPRMLFATLRELVAEVDVVHVQDALYLSSQTAIITAARRHVPSLLTQHVGFVDQGRPLLNALQRGAIRTVGPIVRRADRVVSYNPAVAEWAERTWRLGGVDVLPTGVPAPRRPVTRTELGLPEDRMVALYVGRDVPKKGLRYVLDASDDAYHLVIVTDAAIAARDGFEVRPFMGRDDFSRLLSGVDALVLPSADEGIPLVIQEACVAGTAIVSTMQEGYERFFEAGEMMVVDRSAASIKTALGALAKEPSLLARLRAGSAAAGRRHFGAEAFVGAYESAYAELLAGSAHAKGVRTR